MAKETKTIIVAVCDRCKREGDTSDMDRQEWGETHVEYKGHTGSRSWQGDSAGCSHMGKNWLCLRCTRQFLDFMSGKETPATTKDTQ
jgi:hypothetical protein